MAKNNFNFQAKLELNSSGFKKGVNQVKSSLAGLKSSFLSVAGALGAGLGFTQLIGNIKTTATQLSVAQNTLENVSRVMVKYNDGVNKGTTEVSNYTQNLAFVKRLAKDYGQDLVALTHNYAQFTAACQKTDLALEDQRKVYEALTRSAAYYHMSADRTADMMNAVTQMMSKGKVAAEELRRQLGNALPGAFNLMAASLNMTNSQLDEAMRNGEIIAADVLPRFAAMLNTVTKNAHFDSLQMSLNNMKNAWYELVNDSGAQNFFKGIIDGTTSVITAIKDHLKGLGGTILSFVVGISSYKLFKGWSEQGKTYLNEQRNNLKILKKEYESYLRQVEKAGNSSIRFDVGNGMATAKMGAVTTKELQMLKNYNDSLIQIAEVERKLYGTPLMAESELSRIKSYSVQLDKVLAQEIGIKGEVKEIGKLQAGVESIISTIGATLKSMGIMAVVGAVIGGITKILTVTRENRKEWERINSLYDEYQEKLEETDLNIATSKKLLNDQLDIVKDSTKSEVIRLGALEQINDTLGLTGDNLLKLEDLNNIKDGVDKITKAVNDWNAQAERQSKIQKLVTDYSKAQKREQELKTEIAKTEAEIARKKAINESLANSKALGGYQTTRKEEKLLEKYNAELLQQQAIWKDADKQLKTYGVEAAEYLGLQNGPKKKKDSETKTLSELLKEYNKDKTELTNQLKEKAISEEQFNEELDNLVQEYWKNAAAIGELSIDKILEKMDKGNTLSAMENWYYNLSKDAAQAVQNALINGISEEILKGIDQEIEEASEQIEKELQKEFEKEDKKNQISLNVSTGVYDPIKRGNRNSIMDYAKTGSDIIGEEYDLTSDWFDDIEDKYEQMIADTKGMAEITEDVQKELDLLSEKYRYAAKEAKTLETAMNYQKIVEDIKEVKKEINGLVYSSVKDFATSLDRVVSAWDNLEETMEDKDSTGWEQFMAVFNMMTQIIDSAVGIYQTITTIQELSNKLGAAKIAEQVALNELLKEELALRMAAKGATSEEIKERLEGLSALFTEQGVLAGLLGLKKKEKAETIALTGIKAAEAGATAASASASAGEAVANATSSGAKMPFPYNLLAIAAGVAAVVGALAMMSKFEKGGIVGGNSTHGDKNMVRVNSGEMILNKAQQGTLWSMLNGKGGLGGNVQFKIHGADLVGTINNYNSRKRG